MAKIRKTRTPKWLSITRKAYTYIGTTGLFTALTGRWGLTSDDILLIVEIYLIGGFLIQTACDAYYRKEPAIYKPTN